MSAVAAPAGPDQLLTPKQVSALLGIAEKTLANWRCNRLVDLPTVCVGRCVRYRARDVQAFIEANLVGAADPLDS
jgi:hypothetical protein